MKKYTAQNYYDAIDAFAPFSLGLSWDNNGILIGSPEREVTRALVCLDATVAVLDEAGQAGAQLVVAHHPIIFEAIKSIAEEDAVYRAIKLGLAVVCAHTNLDIATGGINDILARMLDLENIEVLDTAKTSPYRKFVVYAPADSVEAIYNAMSGAGAGRQGEYAGAAFLSAGEGRFLPLERANPAIGNVGRLERVKEERLEMLATPENELAVMRALRAAHPYEEPAYDILETHFNKERLGFGRIGKLKEPVTPEHFAFIVRDKLGLSHLKYVPGREPVSRVALCGGSGGAFLEQAWKKGAQAFVTADIKHDRLLRAKDLGMTVIDAGHYTTEAVVLPYLVERLKAALPGADIRKAQTCAEPGIVLG